MKRALVGGWLVCVLLVCASVASAQIEQGRLSGNVKDSQGGMARR